ncbi:MAG: endonuclease/exonuclease/phosphatase family protein [Desulfobacteraceae bacterium]|nr:endonuclease/exonuclease/phosphatase family protein [Desulfobacteraceae bacterium]
MSIKKVKAGICAVLAAAIVFFLVSASFAARQEPFIVVSWNVENLFDLSCDGSEYPGYIPGASYGWNENMLDVKLENLCRVIADLSPDIIGLQEVESAKALGLLKSRLKSRGENFPFAVMVDDDPATVKCVLLSKYPVISRRKIQVPGEARSILRADLDISGHRLVIFVNHWKSKSGPESRRIAYARALGKAAGELPEDADYILLGDFNSNYDEFRTIRDRPSLNDTNGKTGINHVLRTVSNGQFVDETDLAENPGKGLYYNLWLELEKQRRWSTIFFGTPCSPDAILLPPALYDEEGISYVDNSFDKFDPGYLFDGNRLMRWQREDHGKGRHSGGGYSDHLPVYACFKTGPFKFRDRPADCGAEDKGTAIGDLYVSGTGAVDFELSDCAVIYRHGDNAVIKQKNGRAVYVYEAAGVLEKGMVYDVTVSRLKRYYGNLEITGIRSAEKTGMIKDLKGFYIKDPGADLSDPALENEVISEYCGIYKDGRFYYGNGKDIRLYFRDKTLVPQQESRVCIRHGRIGYHRSPELVIEKLKQIRISDLPPDRKP